MKDQRLVRPDWVLAKDRLPATRKAPVGRSARFASVFFRLAAETPHGTPGSTRGVLSEPRPVLLTNGRSRSSEHLDGLNGRDSLLTLLPVDLIGDPHANLLLADKHPAAGW